MKVTKTTPGSARTSDRRRGAAAASRQNAAPMIKDLLSYRLHAVANLVGRSAAMSFRREFDASVWESLTVALLGDAAPQSLNELAKAAGLDKSQMSRVIAGLIQRKLVQRDVDSKDARSVQLT